MKRLHQIFVFFIVLLISVSLVSGTAMAAIANIKCDTANGGVTSGGFVDQDVISSTQCSTANAQKIFSNIVCNFVIVLNEVFGSFYCALQYELAAVIQAVIVLYIVLFGIGIMIGTQEATPGTMIVALLKIGALAMISTEGAVGVGYVYSFFIDLTIQGINWVLEAIGFCSSGACSSASGLQGAFANIDDKIYDMLMGTGPSSLGGLFSENAELILFFIILMFIFPPIFQIAIGLLWTVFSIFVRSVVSFLMCITAIAFLIALSPIFVSFMLFNTTFRMFESWLRFLISYSLQPLLIFGIFAVFIIVTGSFTNFVKELSTIMTSDGVNLTKGTVATPYNTLSFCRPQIEVKKPSYTLTTSNFTVAGVFTIPLPSLAFVPGSPEIKGCCQLTLPPVVACDNSPAFVPLSAIAPDDRINPAQLLTEKEFIYYLAYHLITILIMAYTFKQMLLYAPQIAQQLAQSTSLAPLGIGFGSRGSGFMHMVRGLSHRGTNFVGNTTNKLAGKTANQINRYAGKTAQRAGNAKKTI